MNGRGPRATKAPRKYVLSKMPTLPTHSPLEIKNLNDQLQILDEMIQDLVLMKRGAKELWRKNAFPDLKKRLELKFGVVPPTMEPQFFNESNEKGWQMYKSLLRQHRDYWELENMDEEGIDLEKVHF